MTPHLLANFRHKYYAVHVPEKKGNEFDSSNYTKAHWPRNAAFLRAYVIASFLWAAVAGRLRPAGFLCVRSVNPAICCPPHLTVGRSVSITQRRHHA